MVSATASMLLLLSVACASFDEIDVLRTGSVQQFLRAMSNDTKGADTLNLPANATSIRENITDTFSCENRTYGYYADVDNECQIFHVCLPSQNPSGRNVTYRWSFICPKETIFNQEVLVCTRPLDAIPCEESPMFYDVNMDIGKIFNEENEQSITPKKQVEPDKETPSRKIQNHRGQRKQNIVVQNLLQNVIEEEMIKIDDVVGYTEPEEEIVEEIVPVIIDMPIDNAPNVEGVEEISNVDEKEIIEERSMRSSRKSSRGGFRFKADV